MTEHLTIDQREKFRSDWLMNWMMFPLLLLLPLISGLAIGCLMSLLYQWGWYLIFLVPFFLAVVLGGIVLLTVRWSHCRNPIMAGSIGLLAGVIALLSSYQFTMVFYSGPRFLHRVDLLPAYIQFRMQTDVQEDAGMPNQRQAQPEPVMNWLMLGFEFCIMAALPCAMAVSRSRHAYNSGLQQWMKNETTLLLAGTSQRLRASLDDGTVEQFCKATKPVPLQQQVCRMKLEYSVPAEGSPLDYPVYLTTTENSSSVFSRVGKPFRQVELNTAEVLALQPLFPAFKQVIRNSHPELKQAPTQVVAAQRPQQTADIQDIPPPFGGTVMTKGFILWINVLGGMPFVFVGFGLLCFYGVAHWMDTSIPLSVVSGMLGLALLIVGAIQALRFAQYAESRYGLRKILDAIRERPDPIVKADEAGALMVGITPRENWQKVKLEVAGDMGLMQISDADGEIRFEGDKQRYRIPIASIVSCDAELFYIPIDQNSEFWMIVLQVATNDETQEIIFGPSHTEFRSRTNDTRRIQARELSTRIERLMAAV